MVSGDAESLKHDSTSVSVSASAYVFVSVFAFVFVAVSVSDSVAALPVVGDDGVSLQRVHQIKHVAISMHYSKPTRVQG